MHESSHVNHHCPPAVASPVETPREAAAAELARWRQMRRTRAKAVTAAEPRTCVVCGETRPRAAFPTHDCGFFKGHRCYRCAEAAQKAAGGFRVTASKFRHPVKAEPHHGSRSA